ncbi:MAG: sortase, partial [Traorella sp.]
EDSDWKDKYQEVLNMEMPTIEIDGHFYVGRLDIEALGLSLPVMNSSSSSNLKIAPCRYYGSVYTDDMVIAAHNYRSHFARLNELTSDDIVKFTDVDGNEFFYQVVGLEVLKPTNVDLMIHSDYDLTLYTCTYGGASRITIRCIRIS